MYDKLFNIWIEHVEIIQNKFINYKYIITDIQEGGFWWAVVWCTFLDWKTQHTGKLLENTYIKILYSDSCHVKLNALTLKETKQMWHHTYDVKIGTWFFKVLCNSMLLIL